MQQNIPNLGGLGQSFGAHGGGSDATGGGLGFNLDPFTAKQMAALQATNMAKAANRSAPGGTSGAYFGGMANQSSSHSPGHSESQLHAFPPPSDLQAPTPPMNVRPFLPPDRPLQNSPPPPGPFFPQPAQSQQLALSVPLHPQQQQQQQNSQDVARQRRRHWVQGLGTLMIQRGTPLPPQLTGVPIPPSFDPANLPFKSLEVSPTDLGIIRLAGVDVDLFKLWGIVVANGGAQQVSLKGAWASIRDNLGLPETVPSLVNPGEQQPLVGVLERYYTVLLIPFEEAYKKNIAEQSNRANAAGRALQARGGMASGTPTMQRPNAPPVMDGSVSGQLPSAQANAMLFQQPNAMSIGVGMPNGAGMNGVGGVPMIKPGLPNGTADLEHDMESRKRKMQEVAEGDAKRARQKTGGSDASESRGSVAPPEPTVAPTITRTIRQPSRRKIEYVPLAPELDTAGGRNLDFIQNEWARVAARPLRHSDEWGHVDIDALTLSLRSRISTELSYSLTTFALLTLARNQHPRDRERDSGFPIAQAPDLLDEAVDLVEDLAFNGVEDDEDLESDAPFMTHKELVNIVLDEGTQPFAALQTGPGVKEANHGPRQRPADIILTVVNIIRNISQGDDNSGTYLAKHEKLIHVMLRLCSLAPRDKAPFPTPLSPILSLSDMLSIRKDVVHLLVNFGVWINLSPPASSSKQMRLTIRRAFEVMASFVVDPSETISPFQYVGMHLTPQNPKPPAPPSLANQALEAFARFTLPDDNRRAVAQIIPSSWIWTMFEALVHRLPVTDHDFQAIMREPWIGYIERLVMCLYSLAFLSPPEIKARAKRDGALGLSKIVLRILRKLTLSTPPESRTMFIGLVRRAIELLKVVDDDAEDSFDSSHAAMPTLAFGVGYGEHGDNKIERGMGMLSAYQEDVMLGLMMRHEVVDQVMFAELESLARLG